MHQNKKKTRMRRTAGKEKQNLFAVEKMHSNKTKHDRNRAEEWTKVNKAIH